MSSFIVSILVPVYGVEKYIERNARSLFEQTYPDLEYVFVNDCTPDGSIDVLKKVLADYPNRAESVVIINHEKNRGLAAARNTALDNATGEFVSIVDSDDWLEKDAIEVLVRKQLETNADIVSGNFYEHRDDGVVKVCSPDPCLWDKEKRVLMVMDGKLSYSIWGRLIRRSLFEENRIRCLEGCDMAEDVRQIILLSYYALTMSGVDCFVYHYSKQNPNSVMKRNQKPDKVLHNCLGHFNNISSLLVFFSTKERVYYEKIVRMTVWIWEFVLRITMKTKAKTCFYDMISWMDRHEDCMAVEGWKKDGLKGTLSHNYHFQRLVYQKNLVFKLHKNKESSK